MKKSILIFSILCFSLALFAQRQDVRRGGVVNPSFSTLTDGTNITWTVSGNNNVQSAKVTLAGARTLVITGAIDGMSGTLFVIQNNVGSKTLALPANSKVINNGTGAVTLSTAANAVDILTWTYDGTNFYWNYGKNYN